MSFLNVQKVNWQKVLVRTFLFVSAIGAINVIYQMGHSLAPQGERALGFLNVQNVTFQSTYNLLLEALILVIPAGLAWYTRTYLKSAAGQKRIGVMSTLANAAINYAEDVERRGERELVYNNLDLPTSVVRDPSSGNQKLYIAAGWLVDEMKKVGGKRMTIDDGAKWIASEYQKRVGDLRTIHSTTALTDLAADLLRQLSRSGHISLPANTLDAASLILSISDWASGQVGDDKTDNGLWRESAMARIPPSSLMATANNSAGNTAVNKITPEVRLTLLARQAVDFVKDLQKRDKLRMTERDTAMAWLIQKVQQDDLTVSREQIGDAISLAFNQA